MASGPSGPEAAAIRIVERLRKAGHEAVFAGGCVRSRLLGLPPKDYDVATSAKPEEVLRLFPRVLEIGRSFGVLQVHEEGFAVEVATFRSDGRYLDGRHPETVCFSDLRSDAMRRDFTVNGMYWDPVEDRILDFVGGQEDLRLRTIRTIGNPDARFDEDRLRLLRAVRFACLLDFEIEKETRAAIVRLAPALREVSAERIRDELKLLLLSPRRSRGLRLLRETGLLDGILPEVSAMAGVDQPPQFHPEGDVWTHTLLCLDRLDSPSFELALATLLHDVGKPRTRTVEDRIRFHGHDVVGAEIAEEIGRRLRLPNEETARVAWMVRHHLDFRNVPDMRPATLKRLLSHEAFPDLERLHRADALSSNGDLSALAFLEKFRREMPDLKPEPLLRGADLLALGWKPGPELGRALRETYDAQLDGSLRTKEEALRFARSRISPSP